MKPGKSRSKAAREQPENSEGSVMVPPNLLAALAKMRTGGAVPVFITRELENFLTEQGVYRDDMRPDEAWAKLNELAGNKPIPEPPAAS